MILIDNIIFDIQSRGGVSNVWKSILKALRNSDLEFKIIKSKNNIQYEIIEDKNLYINDRTIPLFIRRYLNVTNKNVKVFHSSYFRISKSKNVKNILTIHDFTYEKYDKGLRKIVHLAQKKYALKNASAIICVSQNTKNDLLKYHPWINQNIVHVIYNGVDHKVYYPLPKKYKITKQYFLTVGGRNIHKNFEFTLNLMNSPEIRNTSIHLKVIGGGTFNSKEKEFIKLNNLSDRIFNYQNVSDKVLNDFYNGALALIYPSFYEGFGIPPLEALSAGCPVISSKSSSLPEVLGDCGLYVDANDNNSAIKYIDKLINIDYRNKLIEMGLKQASNFSWQKTGKQTLKLYYKLINEK